MFHVDPKFGALCERWYDDDMAWLYSHRVNNSQNGDKHIMLACPVYGAAFAEMFCSYCVPSLIADANARALRNRATLVVFTDKATFRLIMSGCHALRKYGIEFIPRLVPDYVMDEINGHFMNKMWVLGMVHSIAMQMCTRWDMGFSMTVPDVVYSDGFFERLLELQYEHNVILQSSITAQLNPMFTELDRVYRKSDGSISISACDLGMLGWKFLHPQNQQYIMNKAVFPHSIPYTQFQFWQMQDHVQIYSGFSNPIWISHDQCMRVSSASLSTLDTRIPKLGIVDYYVPDLSDNMALVDVSTEEKPAVAPRVTIEDWIDRAWEQLSFNPAFMSYRKRPSKVYIGDQPEYVAQSHVDKMQNLIDTMLLEGRANAMFRRINGKVVIPEFAPWHIHVLP